MPRLKRAHPGPCIRFEATGSVMLAPTALPLARPHEHPLPASGGAAPTIAVAPERSVHHAAAARALLQSYRLHGFRAATIDPLGVALREKAPLEELDLRTFGLDSDDPPIAIAFGERLQRLTPRTLDDLARAAYCGTLALDAGHVRYREARDWLYVQFETRAHAPAMDPALAMRVFDQLVAAEAFEQFQRTAYPRQKQFSLEGCEALAPFTETLIEACVQLGAEDIVTGMAHRGRLNLLLNVFGLSSREMLSLFEGCPDPGLAAWDLRDHLGLTARKNTSAGEVGVVLAHNPSHLGAVSPIVCGIARALQDRKPGASTRKVVPILMHGDAAFPGQGIVAETLNLSQTRGYCVGGTIHVIVNNQIGSTISDPRDARSTLHCADAARAIDAPILHVNADDGDAVVAAARIAAAFRARFAADVVVNLVGYRRQGHFGGDDPTVTQPAMQRRIRNHDSAPRLFAAALCARRVPVDYDRAKAAALATLATAKASLHETPFAPAPVSRGESGNDEGTRIVTAVPVRQLQMIAQRHLQVPPDLVVHSSVQKVIDKWRAVATDASAPVDWCLAESLAYGSLLATGFNVRLTGLDVGRGSFFHRYAVWHDQRADRDGDGAHVPLRHLHADQGFFSIFESPLSEEAVLGFEYGYALRSGRDLVAWEAQFGDFVNNAQAIIDQFIASGEHKWGYENGLVVMLPHGHEGGGPEHSSGYLGRFLQLCAEGNLRVAVPSTSAQHFHLLRRQALADRRKPLIVMTPKFWMHNHAASFSSLNDLARGRFLPILGEDESLDARAVRRLVLTSGKFHYDIASARGARRDVAIARVEALYPFPVAALAREVARYANLREIVWAQEEARNHGAWMMLREPLESVLPRGAKLTVVARPASAACAGCDAAAHAAEQRELAIAAVG